MTTKTPPAESGAYGTADNLANVVSRFTVGMAQFNDLRVALRQYNEKCYERRAEPQPAVFGNIEQGPPEPDRQAGQKKFGYFPQGPQPAIGCELADLKAAATEIIPSDPKGFMDWFNNGTDEPQPASNAGERDEAWLKYRKEACGNADSQCCLESFNAGWKAHGEEESP